MLGDFDFLELVQKFVLGEISPTVAQIQTVGGSHALHLYGKIAQKQGLTNCLLPVPTWDNYRGLLAPQTVTEFAHLQKNGEINFAEYEEKIKNLTNPENSFLVLQGGAPHNQTGKNISLAQLRKIIPLINEKKLTVLIDAAYLGLGDEISRDLEFVRTAFQEINQVALTVSFSKNACLYRHRCGVLLLKTDNLKTREILESHLQVAVRTTISNAPAFGAMVMKQIFQRNFEQWQSEVAEMKKSLDQRREFLINNLDGKLDYLQTCRGMFGTVDFSTQQVAELEKKSIYVLDSGRINFAGINEDNRDYLVEVLGEILSS